MLIKQRRLMMARAVPVIAGVVFFVSKIGAAEVAELPSSPLELIASAGIIGYVLCGLSVLALALIFDAFIHIRNKRLLPEPIIERLEACVNDNDYDAALAVCHENDCTLSRVVGAGLDKIPFGYDRMVTAAQEELDVQEATLYQKLGNLNLIATIAPSLGLLGTVAGMVTAFGVLAKSGGNADAATLANGIYLALITTLEGLVVSIPTAAAFAVLRARVARIMAAMAIINSEILDRFRTSDNKNLPN